MTAMMSSMAVGAEPASSGTTVVNFVCHHCKQPLKLDASINDLDVETFRQLSNFAASGEPQEQAPSSAPAAPSDESVKRIVVARKAEDTIEPPLIRPSLMGDDDVVPAAPRPHDGNVNDSFVLVPLSASEKQKRNLNHRIKVAAKLFDVLSSSAQVDHPLCEDCNTVIQRQLAAELQEAEVERTYYRQFLDTEALINVNASQEETLEANIHQLQQEEKDMLAEIAAIEQERIELANESAHLDAETAAFDREEEEYWQQLNDFLVDQEKFQNERDSLKIKYTMLEEQLSRLRATNAIHDLFHISSDGAFATINNLRLGRLPSIQVDWTEINAALGQTVLCVQTMSRHMKYQFKNYRLIPMGSFSKIEVIAEKTTYELYGPGQFLRGSRFDTAMVAFLDCVNQLCQFAQQRAKNVAFPYTIQGDKIKDLSIKYQQDVAWTKVLKRMMTIIKWLMLQCND